MADFYEQYRNFAAYYDKLMYDVDYDGWSRYIADIIKRYNIKHNDVLEMACGTGNISVRMAAMGYDVTAFDLSEDMLSVASSKAADNGVKIRFLAQDMTNIGISGEFGIILCLCDSINYITSDDDLADTFKWAYNHMKSDGIFIFDINSSYKLNHIIGNNTFTYNTDDLVYIWDNYVTDEKTVEFYLTFFVREGKVYRRFDEMHIERIYEVQYIVKLLNSAGFSKIHINEAFTFQNPNENSERINFTVMK